MVMESNCGLMVQNMKDIGMIIKLKERVLFGMRREMCTKGTSLMTKLTAMECTRMSMEVSTKVTGRMICKRDMEVKCGVMELSTLEITKKEKSIIMVCMNG